MYVIEKVTEPKSPPAPSKSPIKVPAPQRNCCRAMLKVTSALSSGTEARKRGLASAGAVHAGFASVL